MNLQEIDYSAVLVDMKIKRDSLNAAIENMERWLGVSAAGEENTRTVHSGRSATELQSDSFFGLSIPEAVEKYLKIVKNKRTTNDIVEALERGGIVHNSKNFRNTVSTALYREDAKPNGNIAKIGEGEWGLVSWYKGLRERRAKAAGRSNGIQATAEAEEIPNDESASDTQESETSE